MVTLHTLIPWWGSLTLYWVTPPCGLSSAWSGSAIHAEPQHVGYPAHLLCLWPPVLPALLRALTLCALDCSCTWLPPPLTWALTPHAIVFMHGPPLILPGPTLCSGPFSSFPFPTASVDAHCVLPYPMALGMNCSGKKRERKGHRGMERFLLKFGPEKCVQHNCFFF